MKTWQLPPRSKSRSLKAWKPISSILTVGNTAEARVHAASFMTLVIPDTRGLHQQASTNYATWRYTML
jgi:hypothetical protein